MFRFFTLPSSDRYLFILVFFIIIKVVWFFIIPFYPESVFFDGVHAISLNNSKSENVWMWGLYGPIYTFLIRFIYSWFPYAEWFPFSISLLCWVAIAVIINELFLQTKTHSKATYLSVYFILLFSLVHDSFQFPSALLVGFIPLVISFYQPFTLLKGSKKNVYTLSSGFWLGVASLIYQPFILLTLPVMFSLFLYSQLSPKGYLQYLFGAIIPFLIVLFISYLSEKSSLFLFNYLQIFIVPEVQVNFNALYWLTPLPLLILIILFGAMRYNKGSVVFYQYRHQVFILLISLFLGFISFSYPFRFPLIYISFFLLVSFYAPEIVIKSKKRQRNFLLIMITVVFMLTGLFIPYQRLMDNTKFDLPSYYFPKWSKDKNGWSTFYAPEYYEKYSPTGLFIWHVKAGFYQKNSFDNTLYWTNYLLNERPDEVLDAYGKMRLWHETSIPLREAYKWEDNRLILKSKKSPQ